ncbi:ergothioneine biosynthesis protein EgtC [Rhodococcus sp. BP-149]|uniref:ergothioneine biosynthesis protein EgtC n=1 Tax=unclassified Rhodococcus (in: high G+C Gram-positive bacteria) TaxID=192944 RepID=UPI001C9B8699|nr:MULTISPECIES: ergothioneine biosynthesis protein EgtC [unclassified Rhodococcus (in: high G+C Gram-positive bacteria)]MBY6684359.1 ergothioneine biosynthesis protein EgtC [Rhodococcus sp. BP-288]MBY6692980.1 ergothioneine biosynthesis protein EgtC [Rhodococcus sp. BP-188]MBY6697177.1 ergothioneine biosynthesis protein EgtC [Rhodococcus sp. BP-285]MBY6701854.1 ergothioneine biosynthesis protein EgtC [Rhodococcus sp. BP-283]MBY6706869.1 ergothioneine biosynthesis protein EgtC [Rhodococcus sp.
MCRHVGYLGPARTVGDVLTAGPTSLLTQSYAPREMRGGGTINADGFGAAWWSNGTASSYRSAMPMWGDPAVTDTLTHIRSVAVMGAVRSATVGMPVERSACAPFVEGRWAFSHNGVVRGWPQSVSALAEKVPVESLLRLAAPTDSAVLWAILQQRLLDRDPADALAGLLADVDAAAPDSRVNLLLGDGESLWATTLYHSLSVRYDEDSVVLASEPLDDLPGWQQVPDRCLVSARPGSVDITTF